MDNSQEVILNKLHGDDIRKYFHKMNINDVLVFGSLLTDEFNEESDIDIAILGKKQIELSEILRLELFLEDLLERNIDVIDINSETLDIFIKIDILNTGESIYSIDDNEELNSVIDKVDWYYKENEHFFDCRRRDLIS